MEDSPRRMIYSRELRYVDRFVPSNTCADPACGWEPCRLQRMAETDYNPPIAIRWRPDFAKIALRELCHAAASVGERPYARSRHQ